MALSAKAALEAKGVHIHFNASITAQEAAAYDLVLVAVGAQANDDLAVEMGLCEPGQLTADKDGKVREGIYAIGDVAQAAHDFLDAPMRLESVDQAVYAAKCAAAHMMGQPRPAAAALVLVFPGGLEKLQMVGLWSADLRVVPFGGQPGTAAFSLFGFDGDRLKAVQCVNRAPDFAAARRLVARPARF